MGLPVKRFIAANNRNDVFREYLQTGNYSPRASVQTVANAMDVGAPSNFDRILDLYDHSHESITKDIAAYRYSDEEIKQTIREVNLKAGYLLDPHGACAYMALKEACGRVKQVFSLQPPILQNSKKRLKHASVPRCRYQTVWLPLCNTKNRHIHSRTTIICLKKP